MHDEIVIASFYKFFHWPDYRGWQGRLRERCREAGLRGTILLAEEGINATIAGRREAVAQVTEMLRGDARLADLEIKISYHHEMPFQRMKVRLKHEIVALKVPGLDPKKRAGAYVEARDWNDLIAQEDVTVIDARNDYEVQMGSFAGALNPGTESFNELPQFLSTRLDPERHKRVAMFCTGGIRCEKATAYLLERGFGEVYHLRGGVLRYLEQVDPAESLWQGECFVFDERVTVDHSLKKGGITICDDCKAVVEAAEKRCANCGSSNFL
ncbi:MAG: rhodanese-related sulfurtransferase [Chloroflexi bacterium]|nr:rhodanese-related sulfurtransferase [Chloroflexota bacterium]